MTPEQLATAATNAGLDETTAQAFFARAAAAGRIQELEQKLAAYKEKMNDATLELRNEMQQIQVAIDNEKLKLAGLK